MRNISAQWTALTARTDWLKDEGVSEQTVTGRFQWIPASENGPTMPFGRPKMSGFAYVEPRRDVEGAILLHGLPDRDATADVEGRWLSGYPLPETRVGDTIVIVASQRPIALLTVTQVGASAEVPA